MKLTSITKAACSIFSLSNITGDFWQTAGTCSLSKSIGITEKLMEQEGIAGLVM